MFAMISSANLLDNFHSSSLKTRASLYSTSSEFFLELELETSYDVTPPKVQLKVELLKQYNYLYVKICSTLQHLHISAPAYFCTMCSITVQVKYLYKSINSNPAYFSTSLIQHNELYHFWLNLAYLQHISA